MRQAPHLYAMRISVLALLIAAAAVPASAQDRAGVQRDAELWMQQELARQHAISLDNRLMSLEARMRTDQTLRQIEAQRVRPAIPQPAMPAAPAAAPPATSYASIPDDRLAASNARVLAIAGR
jgi:hypothetical protein